MSGPVPVAAQISEPPAVFGGTLFGGTFGFHDPGFDPGLFGSFGCVGFSALFGVLSDFLIWYESGILQLI